MSRISAIMLSAIIGLVSFVIGVSIKHIPYFQCETRIRPFEVINLLVILLFGYWFQSSERKNTLLNNNTQKLLEQLYVEMVTDIDAAINLLDSIPDGAAVDGINKKKIQLRFKSLATNIKYAMDAKLRRKDDINAKFLDLKDAFIDNLLIEDFVITSEFLKDITIKSINLKNVLKEIAYEII